MLDTLTDVDNEEQVESIEKLMNIFLSCCMYIILAQFLMGNQFKMSYFPRFFFVIKTLVGVVNEDQVEPIKQLMKIFICHVLHQFGLVFEGKLFKTDFKCLIDLLDTLMDVDKDQVEYIKKLMKIFLSSCCTSFWPSFEGKLI